jgi:hypothetical protein
MVVGIGETAGKEGVYMPGSKKKPQARPRSKAAPKRAPSKKSPQPAKKVAASKKVAAKKRPVKENAHAKMRRAAALRRARAAPRALASPSKSFAEKVRNCDAGTGIWFVTAGSVEHAALQQRSGDGAVVIRTDAGVTEIVPVSNLFETADEARAARQ